MKLATTLIQKLSIFYNWNVKQKDGGIDQNRYHCCDGDYVATNQQNQKSRIFAVILHFYLFTLFSKTCQNLLFVVETS